MPKVNITLQIIIQGTLKSVENKRVRNPVINNRQTLERDKAYNVREQLRLQNLMNSNTILLAEYSLPVVPGRKCKERMWVVLVSVNSALYCILRQKPIFWDLKYQTNKKMALLTY